MEEFISPKDLNWMDLKNLEGEEEDYLITYILYKEGKSIDLISRIRNLSKDIVQEHILKSKMKQKRSEKVSYHPSFIELLAADKNKRMKRLDDLKPTEREGLTRYLKKVLASIDNAEDKMIALWIAGQLKDELLLPEIRGEIEHKHGGVRRMVCSALGRIPHRDNIDTLHRGLQDTKPQVRQYASKALAGIGDEKTMKRLKNLLNNPRETDYVKRAYLNAIKAIEDRLGS